MKKFTVKDFIAYNNPCFSCDNQINFKIGFYILNESLIPNPPVVKDRAGAYESFLRPVVSLEQTEVDLEIKYREHLTLFITHKNNKIQTNNVEALIRYLSRHMLYLTSTCDKCGTRIDSQFLTFHPKHGYVESVGVSYEKLVVKDKDNIYKVISLFADGKSYLTVEKTDKSRGSKILRLEMPLTPMYKLGDRERFLTKMKTYLLFS